MLTEDFECMKTVNQIMLQNIRNLINFPDVVEAKCICAFEN